MQKRYLAFRPLTNRAFAKAIGFVSARTQRRLYKFMNTSTCPAAPLLLLRYLLRKAEQVAEQVAAANCKVGLNSNRSEELEQQQSLEAEGPRRAPDSLRYLLI